MQLWLVRHTHAVKAEEDPRRPLSPAGRAAAEALGRLFRANGQLGGTAACWHSPLVRALETATLLGREAGLDMVMQEVDGLDPEADPTVLADRLEAWTGGNLVVVGHEPHLSALGTLLVRGKVRPVQFDLRKGAVLALENSGETHKKSGRRRWLVRWLWSPELASAAGATAEPPLKEAD